MEKYRDAGEPTPIHSVLIGGANHLSDGLTSPMTSTIKPSARRHSTGISHSVHFTGARHHFDVWPALALGTSLTCLCRIMPRPCISARSPTDYCANYSAQLFHPVEVSISQARSPNAVPRRHASPGTRKRSVLGTNVCCPLVGQTPNYPCHQSIIGYVLAHGTPANPCMKRQTYYIIIIDTCSLRLSADWREKLAIFEANFI